MAKSADAAGEPAGDRAGAAPYINANELVMRLWRTRRALPALVDVISPEDVLWRPASGGWSVTEIVWHMVDEEAEDFRLRLRMTLDDPTQAWPAIDPSGWATARNYQNKPVGDALRKFVSERSISLAWLRSLRRPDWTKTYNHPKLGPMRAGDILSAWAAHDALHIRQIAKRMHQLAARDAGGYAVGYAGEWGA